MGVRLCHGGGVQPGRPHDQCYWVPWADEAQLEGPHGVGAVGTGLFEASCQWSHQLGTGPAGRTARARGPCPNLKARECPESGLAESRLGLPGVGPEHRLDSPAGRARLSGGP